ncbi:MAG: Putative xylulose kinase [uncultured Rubrobacteraceae bacterium]|uniref:Xylulose kinase n=1 Tax=uncultured Rubrobacteraceae bacterium TaxID=349277 RepID=A0A6J4PN80_9ACTN|nr:MAG: Putative xylulose kinase [uncultured Rubrobacteraceae bacterium]
MLLGLDLGTGSVKTLLLAGDGAVLGEGSASYPVRSTRPGWAESRPEDWWESVVAATGSAVGGRGAEVTALGLSGQMHGVVLSDEGGRPLRPAVLWADSRSGGELEAYRGLDRELRRLLANPPAVGMAGPSLLWLRRNEPDVYGAARWALQPKDWLRLRLTGEAASEPSDASATLLYDLVSDRWAYPVVEALGLRPDLLAPLVPSGGVAGGLARFAAAGLGLRAGVPVAAGAADTAAAMLGCGLLGPGPVQLTVGTGAQIFAAKREPVPDPNGRTHLYRAAAPNLWYSMAAIQNAGLALEWARGLLGVSWERVYEEAFSVLPGAGGVSFLPYLSGERTPRFDPAARGAWTGLGLDHGRAHLLRAALEGVAFALREGLEALEDAGTDVPELRLAGGGAGGEAGEPWRQLLADVLGRPLHLLPDGVAPVASARGAALLAGLASGVHRTVEDVRDLAPGTGRTILPGEQQPLYGAAYERYLELYPRLGG